MRILFIGGVASSLGNFRKELITTLVNNGHDVSACSGEPDPWATEQLKTLNVKYFPVALHRTGKNPIVDVIGCIEIYKIIKQVQPDIIFSYTIKPIVWGGVAAKFSRTHNLYAMVEGLGMPFMPQSDLKSRVTSWLAQKLYYLTLPYYKKIFFLNSDDLNLMSDHSKWIKKKAVLLNGIGVDLNYYYVDRINNNLKKPLRFLLISRMIEAKGVLEYIKAAKKLGSENVEFIIVGPVDNTTSDLIKMNLNQCRDSKYIKYHGELNDIRSVLKECDVFVLPSYYREGLPRTILEAMASGMPVITTDNPGCRETVRLKIDEKQIDANKKEAVGEGVNGFLISPKSTSSLIIAMEEFIKYPEKVAIMGRASRQLAEEKYCVHKINRNIIKAMGLLGKV